MSRRDSLDAAYFDGVFAGDADPWNLASSDYEAAKFAHTCQVLCDRRYARALEVGCAHGVLTERLLPLCDTLLAIDISGEALQRARNRLGERPGLVLRRMAFPRETPGGADHDLDLVVLSEVAYYWSDEDLARAGAWMQTAIGAAGRALLVHYTGETDYPQGGDEAVDKLRTALGGGFVTVCAERRPGYRLDLWARG